MPDSTMFPLDPLLLRTPERWANEPGDVALHRVGPGDLGAAAIEEPRPPTNPGTTVHAKRREVRWRDIQWIDFTSDTDSNDSDPEPAPMPETALAIPEFVEPLPMSPALRGVLRHFAKPLSPSARARHHEIAGLPGRFVRVSVPRVPSDPQWRVKAAPSPVRLRQPPLPELPTLVWRPATAPAKSPEVPRLRSPPASGSKARPYPPASAAMTAPVALELAEPEGPGPAVQPLRAPVARQVWSPPDEPAVRRRWLLALAQPITDLVRSRMALREASAAAALRAPVPEKIARTRVAQAIDAASRPIVVREYRLRTVGLLVLTVTVVALAAYAAGLLVVVTLTGSPASATSTAASNASKPPAVRQLAAADQVIHAQQASASATVPSGDPAARAAVYIARAKAGDVAAEYDVGVFYARGDGLVQDYASALSWFHAAAAEGNVAAQYNLGVLYAGGLGVAADQAEALNWFRSAADQNHARAQYNLALAYAQGNGTDQDFATAARWYQRAARQGLEPAMLNLAILYEQGSGVARSPVEAYAWYSAAAERGDTDAGQRAGELFKQFDDKDKARAQGLAATIGAALDAAVSGSMSTAAKS